MSDIIFILIMLGVIFAYYYITSGLMLGGILSGDTLSAISNLTPAGTGIDIVKNIVDISSDKDMSDTQKVVKIAETIPTTAVGKDNIKKIKKLF